MNFLNSLLHRLKVSWTNDYVSVGTVASWVDQSILTTYADGHVEGNSAVSLNLHAVRMSTHYGGLIHEWILQIFFSISKAIHLLGCAEKSVNNVDGIVFYIWQSRDAMPLTCSSDRPWRLDVMLNSLNANSRTVSSVNQQHSTVVSEFVNSFIATHTSLLCDNSSPLMESDRYFIALMVNSSCCLLLLSLLTFFFFWTCAVKERVHCFFQCRSEVGCCISNDGICWWRTYAVQSLTCTSLAKS